MTFLQDFRDFAANASGPKLTACLIVTYIGYKAAMLLVDGAARLLAGSGLADLRINFEGSKYFFRYGVILEWVAGLVLFIVIVRWIVKVSVERD